MNLLRLLLFISFCVCSVAAKGQITDNFSDGKFHPEPNLARRCRQFYRQSRRRITAQCHRCRQFQSVRSRQYPQQRYLDLRFRLGFSPSTSNLLRIYLMADQQNLSAANGYFIEIGETGSTDALRLFRQNGTTNTLLGTGSSGLVRSIPTSICASPRTLSGQWTVEAASGTGALAPEFNATDATHSGGATRFFGFQCVYTSSNITKFFFDDVNITLGPPDTDPPTLVSATGDNELQVTAVFNESLDATSAANAANYNISNGIGQPASAVLQPDGISVKLTLSNPLVTGNYTLETTGIQDAAGNASAVQTLAFSYVKMETAAEFDILINEIMADQTPAQALPEVEWFELYNRSSKSLDLANLRFQDATGSPVNFPTYMLEPGAYVAITALANTATLQAGTSGPVLGLAISATTLNNDSDVLTLTDAAGNVIDRVPYSIDWHTDIAKRDGGWSLERINPNLICLGSENWKSCPAAAGGTPGVANAALSTAPDQTAPRLTQILIESNTSLLVTFSEGIDKLAAQDPSAYVITPARTVATAAAITNNRAQVRLTLADPLQLSTVYALTAKASLTDCAGNSVPATDTLYIGLAEIPGLHDVIINEIMPKPAPSAGLPAVEWLELLNRSSKIIDLGSLRLQDQVGNPVSLPNFLLVPGKHIALTALANASTLQASASGRVIGASISASLLNDDGDVITLSNSLGETIDRVAYDGSWHTTPGKEDGGWSLERVNFNLPCLGSENWQSCPLLPGGTPGVRNAAYQNTSDTKEPHLWWAYPESATSVMLNFSEGLDKTSAGNASAYQFSPSLDVLSATQQPNILQVRLSLAQPMQAGVSYLVTVSQALSDCAGNTVTTLDTIVVGLPQRPEPQDIIVNEAHV